MGWLGLIQVFLGLQMGQSLPFCIPNHGCLKSESYLMLADLLLGEICPIVDVQTKYGRPVWSPDGDKLAFVDFGSNQLKINKIG